MVGDQALTGPRLEAEDDWHSVVVDGEWRLGFPETSDEVFQVYADPAGHPFCLCRGPLTE